MEKDEQGTDKGGGGGEGGWVGRGSRIFSHILLFGVCYSSLQNENVYQSLLKIMDTGDRVSEFASGLLLTSSVQPLCHTSLLVM